ncbi:GNAT family N-acetyltransferase [uncultured Roseobacter sp.]|uniref:GNAT family N-acetyltransferase n=1 Tax=uncultured Roseobacter sp. TaxID=114847 RepID=UPI00262BDD32|nr:GNAT family N-acetyltransferase [uncultured Roseobacter sp.]
MIRAARPEDAEDIARLWNTMIRDTLSTFTTVQKTTADIKELIADRPDAFLVAESGGAFAGFITFGPFRAGPGYAATAEHTVLVTPEAAGSGAAAGLLHVAEKAAAAQGVHVMVAGISGTNRRAIAFHRRQGYTELGRMPQVGRKSERWLDLVLMQKILGASR